MVTYDTAARAVSTYRPELQALDQLPTHYGQLVDSAAARRAWLAEAQAMPGLSRLAAVWAFKEGEHPDTGCPTLSKAVILPGVLWSPPQERQEIDGLGWGAAGELLSVKKLGQGGYLVAFFR